MSSDGTNEELKLPLSKVATGKGDEGTTGLLFGGNRISKDDVRTEAYGTVDEATAALGMARAEHQLLADRVERERVEAAVRGAALRGDAHLNPAPIAKNLAAHLLIKLRVEHPCGRIGRLHNGAEALRTRRQGLRHLRNAR